MQLAYQEHRYAARNGTAFDATLRAIMSGMTTGKPVPEAVLGLALMDMAANGEAFNASRVRGYIRKHEAAAQLPTATARPGAVDWAQITRELEAEYAAKESQ